MDINEEKIKELTKAIQLKERRWAEAKKSVNDILTDMERSLNFDEEERSVEVLDDDAIFGIRNSLGFLLANMEETDETVAGWEQDQADFAARHRRRVLFFPNIRRGS